MESSDVLVDLVSLTIPRVIKLAESKVNLDGVQAVMSEYGGVALDWFRGRKGSWHSDSEMLVEIAGRVCYRSFGVGLNMNITQIRSESKDYFNNILRSGDGSILEHGTVTFALMWVSRVLTHELVRHRVGTAFSQESLRYVRQKNLIVPKWEGWFPVEVPDSVRDAILEGFTEVEQLYGKIASKIDWERLSFEQKKRATSAIRRVLPQGIATVIIFTANHRTLRWLIEMRTHPSAELEIRQVFGQIAEICLSDYPLIYNDFKKSKLADGTIRYEPTLRSKV